MLLLSVCLVFGTATYAFAADSGTSGDRDVNLTISSMMSMTIANTNAINFGSLTPESSGTKTAEVQGASLNVKYNGTKGYNVGLTLKKALKGKVTSVEIASAAASADGDASKLGAKTWGVKAQNSSKYAAVGTTAINVMSSSGPSAGSGDTYAPTFGIKIDTSLKADTYEGAITYTLTEKTS
jgi:hypothetical protein